MRTGFWFLVVGASAALTHLLVFLLSEHWVWPEVANAMGFCVAFFVSFFGHRWLSFADTDTGLWQSLRRFAVTALAGFVANELTFVVLLRALDWPSWLALVVALVLASVQTFVLSRFWAFKRAA
jgi:putative flippase GtrA